MTTRRTWVWVIVAVAGAGVVCLILVAGAGVYFVSQHVHAAHSTASAALTSFDQVTASFSGRRALYELNAALEPQLAVPLAEVPGSPIQATALWVQAWNPEDERLVRLSLPLWLLRFGEHRMRVLNDEGGFDLRELSLDLGELSRIGPVIVLDYRRHDGVRILLWTK